MSSSEDGEASPIVIVPLRRRGRRLGRERAHVAEDVDVVGGEPVDDRRPGIRVRTVCVPRFDAGPLLDSDVEAEPRELDDSLGRCRHPTLSWMAFSNYTDSHYAGSFRVRPSVSGPMRNFGLRRTLKNGQS